MANKILITKEFIDSNKTAKGAWTKKQITALGLIWPLTKGWQSKLIGSYISIENAGVFSSSEAKMVKGKG